MTTEDMVRTFGAEATTNPDANLDAIHDVAWSLFNTYAAEDPLPNRALFNLGGSFADVNQLIASKTAPS